MKRRNFLIGASGTAIGASALVGSGAFSRVESDRAVSIAVAKDPDAYLGMSAIDTPNSDNYVGLDDKGHLEIDIADQGGYGEGVNSNSTTWFDGMFEICNQGKQDAGVYIDTDDLELADNAEVDFYMGTANEGTQSIVGKENATTIELGECITVGLKTMTYDVDAADTPLVEGDITVTADVEVLTADGPVRNARSGDRYTSIQSAVDEAEAGDTIEVLTGETFVEDVTIDVENLTLEATSNAKPTIDADGATSAVEVEAGLGDVTVEGFKVKGWDAVGIVQGMSAKEGTALHAIDNEVHAPDESGAHGNSIQVTGDGSSVIGNTVDIPHQPSEDWSGTGVLVFGADDAVVDDNHVNLTGEGQDFGIAIGGGRWGISPAHDTIVTNNEISGGAAGIALQSKAIDTEITNNTITENVIGLAEEAVEGDEGENLYPEGTIAHNNDIFDNEDFGATLTSKDGGEFPSGHTLDATENWWGDETGPSGEGPGDGDAVGEDVLFDPWSTESGPNWNDDGTAD